VRILLVLASDIAYRAPRRTIRAVTSNLEPLMLKTLAALVPAGLDAEIDMVDEGVTPGDYAGRSYDIVGISATTSASARAYALARYWRMKGAFTVLGGPPASLMPEEAAARAAAVVVGPAEPSWPRLIGDFIAGKQEKIYRSGGSEWMPSPAPSRPSSRRGYCPISSVSASRGCANHCVYCSMPAVWDDGLHKRPVEEVAEEIKELGTKYVLLLDPSPFCDRDYAMSLFHALMGCKVGWACQATVDAAFDRELLDLMARSGCLAVFAGMETFSPASMAGYGKAFRDVNLYREAVSNFHEKGISVAAGMMLGGDGDTRESLDRIADDIDECGLDLARFGILTPYPGTPLHASMDAEGRLLHKKWHLYDEDHAVFRPANMEPEELEAAYRRAWKETYRIPRIARRLGRIKTMPVWLNLIIQAGFRDVGRKLDRLTRVRYDPERGLERF